MRRSTTALSSWDFFRRPGTHCNTREDFFERVHPDDRQLVANNIEATLKLGIEYHAKFRAVRPDASIRHVEARGQPIHDKGGRLLCFIGVCHDITAHIEAELQARKLLLMQQREDFMATLTHDLKNPLLGANRVLDLLVEGKLGSLTTEQTDLLLKLRNSNAVLLSTIQNLLVIYRYERDPNVLTFQETDLSLLVKECLDQMSPIAEQQQIELTFKDMRAAGALPVSADSQALRRVIQNLLDNAIKFTPQGGKVSISLKANDESAQLEVADTGSGIQSLDHHRLFERFWQGETGRRYQPGTGLGLYLCRLIVQAHGGEIIYRCPAEGGTVFSVRLPARNG